MAERQNLRFRLGSIGVFECECAPDERFYCRISIRSSTWTLFRRIRVFCAASSLGTVTGPQVPAELDRALHF